MPTALTTREFGTLTVFIRVEYSSSAFRWKHINNCKVHILCFILYFHLRTQPSSRVDAVFLVRPLWAAGPPFWGQEHERCLAWLKAYVHACLTGTDKACFHPLWCLFFCLCGTTKLFFCNLQVYKSSHCKNSLFQGIGASINVYIYKQWKPLKNIILCCPIPFMFWGQ